MSWGGETVQVNNEAGVHKVIEDAEEACRSGFLCAESVVRSICDNFGLDLPDEVIKQDGDWDIRWYCKAPAVCVAP